ncbi:TetR/AcrR family transcriptional regulator [Gordonia sp. NPDC058843]|uniref:TetR/AcrR family transcriptional regulator n=1 Tax=Gordonia sp. NPDC058843 TaxID=3346648 RepID=UPI003697591F
MTSASAPAKPMRADARRNYEKVVATAAEAFRESGIDTSLDDIAKRAGVGAGTLYRHFPSREALVAAAMRQDNAALVESAQTGDREEPGERLVDWVRALARHIGAYQGLPEIIIAAAGDPESPLYTSCADIRVAGADILGAAQRSGGIRTDLTVDELFTLANMIALGRNCVESQRLLELVIEGIRGPGA